jgi:hypothetical protein
MFRSRIAAVSLAFVTLGASLVTVGANSTAGASTAQNCSKLTKSVVVADGFTKAIGPKVTPYNYKVASKNAPNALGTTYDFGKGALVIGCVSPADLVHLSADAQGAMKPTMSATAYLNYMVKQSAGAMTKTKVGPVFDYLDFGNGKEDGLGSTATASSVRLDAWVAGKYLIFGFIAPVTTKPTPALLKLVDTTLKVL